MQSNAKLDLVLISIVCLLVAVVLVWQVRVHVAQVSPPRVATPVISAPLLPPVTPPEKRPPLALKRAAGPRAETCKGEFCASASTASRTAAPVRVRLPENVTEGMLCGSGGRLNSNVPMKAEHGLQRQNTLRDLGQVMCTTVAHGPMYPQLARQARIEGKVLLKAVIDAEGNIKNLELIEGHPLLAPAAIDAVKRWKYKPYMLDGKPVEVETTITANFSLSGG